MLVIHSETVSSKTPTDRYDVSSIVLLFCVGSLGNPFPVPKRKDAKHNPLQRITYLILAAILLPVQMVTGLFYWGYNSWPAWGLSGLSLEVVAMVHLAGAFAILSFVIVHIYMITTGHTILAHTRAMITGWEEVKDLDNVGDWEVKTKVTKAKA